MNLKNKIFFSIYIVISIFVIILSIELLLYYTSDQSRTAKLYPRYEFLDEIGIIPKKNVIMKHSVRGYSTKTYTINEQRYRGDLISIDDQSKKIIVLGDSHSFGVGVNDHETFSFKLDKLLGDHKVINLSSPGWGLTHQINRYLTIGENHKPEIIIIQFCSNDPSDNKREESIIWDKDKLEFIKIKIGDSQYNSTQIIKQI